MSNIRAVSYGGGVQSTALLVLAANKQIDFNLFLFSNVGDDSERPDTLKFVRQVAMPFAKSHGIELVELNKTLRGGGTLTLMQAMEQDTKSIPIPMYLPNRAPGNRHCTWRFKIEVIAKELRLRGATKENKAILALGISLDEFSRSTTKSRIETQILSYPLIDMRIDRSQCVQIISDAGLQVPPKSSCFFCPFNSRKQWLTLLRKEPELFEKSVNLEKMLNERRRSLGKDHMYLSDLMKPLDKAITENGQLDMFDDDMESTSGCANAGYCMI